MLRFETQPSQRCTEILCCASFYDRCCLWHRLCSRLPLALMPQLREGLSLTRTFAWRLVELPLATGLSSLGPWSRDPDSLLGPKGQVH